MEKAVLSIDVGTTGSKIIAFNPRGDAVFTSYVAYKTITPEVGYCELSPDEVWQKIYSTLRQIPADSLDIKVISVSSLGEAAVLIDKAGNVIENSILYNDIRGVGELEEVRSMISKDDIQLITGQPLSHLHTLLKLLWIKKYRPESYKQINKIMFFADYIVYKLTGSIVTDYSLAARSLLFDIRKYCWSERILSAFQINEEILPPTASSGTVIGSIQKSVADELALSIDTKVVLGGHDQPCGALGAGCMDRGDAVNASGTVECMTVVIDDYLTAQQLTKTGYSVEPYVIEGKFVTMGFSITGGSILQWYRKICLPENEEFYKPFPNPYAYMDTQIDRTPSGMIVFPFFAGTGTPEFCSSAYGAILGLTLYTKKEDLFKALIEGLVYEIRQNIEIMEGAGAVINKIRTIGGGSYSDVWLQLKADILNKDITTVYENQAVSLGLAILSSVAVGWDSNVREAVGRFVKEKKVTSPQSKFVGQHNRKFETYKVIYPQVAKKLF